MGSTKVICFVSLVSLVRAVTLYSSYTFDPLQHLAGITPYWEPQDPPRDPAVPQGCSVTRAAYLVRHAAINANDFDYEEYLEPFLDKLANTTIDWSRIPDLSFLANWSPPDISEQEILTRTGRLEAAQLGVSLSYRYPTLRLPERVWASTSERTVASARSFIRGLEIEDNTINLVQIYEGEEAGADSLTPYDSCSAYDSSTGSDQEEEFFERYTRPIQARFNASAPGFNFTTSDVAAMQELCGYDTVIRGSSPFCDLDLFRPDEWLSFKYGNDIFYHYSQGYGNPLAGVIGFPWVNATMNLLTADTSAQDLYVSFTHRELPPMVLVALGLFNNSEFSGCNNVNETMPINQVNYHRAWISSHILPFLTNIAIERMNCSESYGYEDFEDPTFYRVLVNQSPHTLPGCFDGPAESCSAEGLREFLSGRAAMFAGYSERCEVEYDNSTDVVSFYTSSNNGSTVG